MILLYHLLFPDDAPRDTWNAGKVVRASEFKLQVTWLRRHFNLVSLEKYIDEMESNLVFSKRNISLTFDDGYHNTFELVSDFLIENNIPATFFVSTSHLEDGRLFWFAYFNALCFEKVYKELKIGTKTFPLVSEKTCYIAWHQLTKLARESGDSISFSKDFAEKYPLPENIKKRYLGLDKEQILTIGTSETLSLGGHTHHHPYLDTLSYENQLDEILKNKHILEDISTRSVPYFAYTGGIYNSASLMAVINAGYKAAFTISSLQLGTNYLYEIPRIDIYSPSIIKLNLKVHGISEITRRIRLKR